MRHGDLSLQVMPAIAFHLDCLFETPTRKSRVLGFFARNPYQTRGLRSGFTTWGWKNHDQDLYQLLAVFVGRVTGQLRDWLTLRLGHLPHQLLVLPEMADLQNLMLESEHIEIYYDVDPDRVAKVHRGRLFRGWNQVGY